MNRRTFLKGVGLLLACIVPNIVKVEEEKSSLEKALQIKERYKNFYKNFYEALGWEAIESNKFELKGNWSSYSDKKRQALAQIIKDAEDELNWTAYINKMTMISLTEEKDGLYYELARSPLYPNTDTDNKFDGISHLIDKERRQTK